MQSLLTLRRTSLSGEKATHGDTDDVTAALRSPPWLRISAFDEGSSVGTLPALALSVLSSVAIVICNKFLMSNLGFSYATTLTSWHMAITYATLHVARKLHYFEHKALDLKTVALFGLLNGASVGFLNLSLGFNSVGFYQMMKLAIIPVTVAIEMTVFGKTFSARIQAALAVLLLGVGVATVTDVQLNPTGLLMSLLALGTTCLGQILTNHIQQTCKVSATQLLYDSCPYMLLILGVTGPFLDYGLTGSYVYTFPFTVPVMAAITFSCIIAVLVNFSTFLVIGKTSPVTYQVLGHLKTCLVILLSFLLLGSPFRVRNVVGILVAMVGMALYSYVCISDKQNNRPRPVLLPKAVVAPGDAMPLRNGAANS